MGRLRSADLTAAVSIWNDGARGEWSIASRPCRDRMDGQGPFDEFQDSPARLWAGAARSVA